MSETRPWHDRLRVAAVQFATGTDVGENLHTCLRMLDTAAAAGAELAVFPEFCNHISVYDDAEHCRSVAVELEGEWMSAVAERAARHRMHVALAVTVPRASGSVTVTSVLFADSGEIIAAADKHTLMGNERAFLSGGSGLNPVADTKFGPVGLYACMDGVTFETPRSFAVRGARLLLNSLNSFARDEAGLHVPVRAAENGVFVVAANKVGPLLPPQRVAEFSRALGVPPEALEGAGESQVVTPDGTSLAIAAHTGEAVVTADLDLSQCCTEQRMRGRRHEVYAPLARPETATPRPVPVTSVTTACVPAARDDPHAARAAVAAGAQLIVLPELAPVPEVIPGGVLVVTTTMRDRSHIAQVWTDRGIVHEQAQIHHSERHRDVSILGDSIELYPTPFGDLALIVGDDHLYPETMRLAAVAGAHLAAVCWRPEHRWERDLALVERAAENRICVAACGPPGHPGNAMLLNPPADSLWNPNRRNPYDGTINNPERAVAAPADAMLVGELHPSRSLDCEISKNTDLVGGRAWRASRVLASEAG